MLRIRQRDLPQADRVVRAPSTVRRRMRLRPQVLRNRGVPVWVAPLVAPAVDLSIIGLVNRHLALNRANPPSCDVMAGRPNYADRMSKRSTPFQAIVRLVRQHFAEPGVAVAESKLLRDAVLGNEREVDIVIEGNLDGEPMVISVEVREQRRPATLNWVQEMIQKHRNLPTNLLLLVSSSGFSKSALSAIDREANVQALTPEVIEVGGEAVVKRLYMDLINYSATSCTVYVRSEDGRTAVPGQPDTDIYGDDGTLLGPLAYLVHEAIHLDSVSLRLSIEAHSHPERDQVKTFSLGLAMPQLGYHLKRAETGELHVIEELEVWGDFTWAQTEVPLTLTKLGGRVYGAAQAPIAGRPAVWVGTSDLVEQTTTISWQTTDAAGPLQPLAQFQPMHFPGLLKLFPPGAWAAASPVGTPPTQPPDDGRS
jgi:hypothetical protein